MEDIVAQRQLEELEKEVVDIRQQLSRLLKENERLKEELKQALVIVSVCF